MTLKRLIPCLMFWSGAACAADCRSIDDDVRRLTCYDQTYGRGAAAAGSQAVPAPSHTDGLIRQRADHEASAVRTLTDLWDLDPAVVRAPFEIRTYKPTYLLVATSTNRVNQRPSSGQPANNVTTPLGLDATEAQYQLSFKTKVWNRMFGSPASLWFGYTQSSRWQVYNGSISRPFRETNYEPELMVVVPTPVDVGGGWRMQMAGLGINHQSNGRAVPLSRSWNRVIGQVGFEKDDTMVMLRPWFRIHENARDDDNPGIENYMGRGELLVATRFGKQVLSLQARHSLRGGANNRGSLRADWAVPLSGYLKAYFSVSSGYGESMIDFNHRQTMIGAGISLVEWR